MKNKILKISLVATLAVMVATSCKKTFLDENLQTIRDLEYYKTDAGIQQLVNGAYHQVFATPFNGEMAFSNMCYGVDEFRVGGDPSNGMYNSYGNTFGAFITPNNGNTVAANAQWDNLYIGIGHANMIIENATASASTADAIKKTALGEGYFLRAYNYLRLVSQYGAVPLKTKPSTAVELEFTRATPKEVYDLIIADFTQAYNLLGNGGSPAKITKDAAAHFLAKAYLSRTSEINDSWNSSTKAADLAAIVPLCDAVIANHSLAPNFGDLWRYTAPNGANENLREIILSAQFTSDLSASGSNTQHLYFVSRYEDITQMQRDLSGDRPFSRLAPTHFMYRIYDMQNDSRFWKSFRTKHKVNAAAPTAPYVQGDLGIMYVINQPGDTRFSANLLNNSVVYSGTGKTIPHVYIAYRNGQTNDIGWNDTRKFPSLNKYMDGSRTAGFNDVRGLRDITLARSAETYLIAAEAKIRAAKLGTGSYSDALVYINTVRARAQYANGESRSAYYDGGAAPSSAPQSIPPSFFPENSYYESNNIPVTTAASASLAVTNIATLPASDEYIINLLGYSSTYDRMLCFLLNERSRELAGEYLRWQDLSRTKTLIARAKAFNPDAAPNIQDRHLLRPIPQTFLDGIQLNGVALTGAQKQAMQNPGY
ncbi:RagB/SusD family nutrient uptake outer membrane protein [Lacibacter sediminis]|uniref:RagB/SusD family nutrient uptake outer membrane protein n=1 Tax=Lacibacter sediminis TaxID=2760713 RepID=A0A7G5XAZ7_9BACT|nr:RagB/SusD family nutrient uptake outer membrane protein [Lacibacter sediminis]QNA42650.1 RagB/SusD family nutrient uptake outer membrane protein [Lacibacter sediminis]